jgi:hypothetical protein
MKTPKIRLVSDTFALFCLSSLITQMILPLGLLGYEHILTLYFALAIPWMSSPYHRDSLTNAALLSRA